MVDDSPFVPRTELEARFTSLESRLGKVEKATNDMADQQTALISTFKSNSEKLEEIHAWITKANGAWGFVRRHGPKVGYLVVGIAISRGWISAENGHNFLSIFGIGG